MLRVGILDFITILVLAGLVQSFVSAVQIILNEACVIKESRWRKWGAVSFWTSVIHLTGAILAGLTASLVPASG